MSSRTYEPVEELMMSLYISERLSGRHVFTHLRLGQPEGYSKENPAPREQRQFLMSTLHEADVVTRTLDRATIYEFTIWRPQTKLGQLQLYRGLLPATPGFEDLDPSHVDLVIVSGQANTEVVNYATSNGIKFEFYLPPAVAAKVAERRGGQK